MNEKKKAAQVQHQDGDGEQMQLDGFNELPAIDFITEWTPAQDTIAALLSRNRAQALTTRELARITGQQPRQITKRICYERRHGAPILSDPAAGFWLASDQADARRCAAALHRRAVEVHKTARCLEKAAGGEQF